MDFFLGGGDVMLKEEPVQNPELEILFSISMTFLLEFMKSLYYGKTMDISPSAYWIFRN